MTDNLEPCGICGSDVHIKHGEGPERGGVRQPLEIRVCNNPRCRSNTAPPRMGGDKV